MLKLASLLALALIWTAPAVLAQAPSQSKIAACQASITIPSYQDYYYYDVSDTTLFTVTYMYDPAQCVGVPVQGIQFTDYSSGATTSCTSAPFSSTGTYTSTCQKTKGAMATEALAAGPDGSDFSTTLRFGVKPTLYVREDIFSIIGSDARTTMVTSTTTAATSTTTAPSTITSPPPTVSQNTRRRRRAVTAAQVDLSNTVCDKFYTACPVRSKTGWLTRCIDTTSDLYACGGCPGTFGTQDCSELTGVADVQCFHGTCQIELCDRAHKLSTDGKTCIAKQIVEKRWFI